ncbi:SprT family zinc-dependent metalloprotease [Niallia nealsonii]|uniref:SprT-like domain-containing protein n=1 Tax=Niallia nealsonii TaxID=115979 RepID=A0A2N0Z372_9BACI|nr:hypothetical protein [Niallia nealsonii]PKG23965.1 hypothetical protein CWS01_09355 [Niallia nealsonii]
MGAYRIYLDGFRKPVIEMSEVVNQSSAREDVFDTLLHEMVYCHLHTTGQPYNDENLNFIEECYKVGVSIRETKAAQKALEKFEKTQE